MSEKITPLPMPFTTNVTIDARAADVSIRVDPALIFTSTIMPGEIIPDDQETGIALIIQKGSEVNVMTVLTNDKADQLMEALVTCIVRGDPKKQERAEALMERFMKACTEGFESPARTPGEMPKM